LFLKPRVFFRYIFCFYLFYVALGLKHLINNLIMKKIYILAAMVAFAFNSNAQFDDDFDFYALGDISAQSANWTTWSGTDGSAEDADVSDAQANSGANSLYVSAGNDMLMLTGDRSAGTWTWQYDVYVVAGSAGFLGTMSGTTTEFALQMYFDDADEGTVLTDPTGAVVGDFVLPTGAWVTHRWVINLDDGTAVITQNGDEIYSGDFFRNELQSVDIWDDGGADFYMDNVIFVEGEILDTNDFTANSFSVYPNPVSNVMNIESTGVVSNVTVYDVLGKVVLQSTPGTVSPRIDTSILSSGAYLVNVTIDGASKTVKIIK
jgi:hypothetical protein